MSEEKVKKKGNPLVLVLIILLVLILVGGGFLGFMLLNKSKDTGDPKPVKETTFELDEFVTNLADEDKTFIKITIVLGYEENKKLDSELPTKVPAIRDVVNSLLWTKTSIDFSGTGTEKVKQELLDSINSKLNSGKLLNIYLNEIIIQ